MDRRAGGQRRSHLPPAPGSGRSRLGRDLGLRGAGPSPPATPTRERTGAARGDQLSLGGLTVLIPSPKSCNVLPAAIACDSEKMVKS